VLDVVVGNGLPMLFKSAFLSVNLYPTHLPCTGKL
jgi:hypothetical protein